MKKKFSMRVMSALLAAVMMVVALPLTSFAAPASDLPENMKDHAILRALEYTGYDVQQQKNNGTLYQDYYYGSRTPSSILSNISYGTALSGKETVSDSSTVTGKAPAISRFEQNGMCCASFVTYFVCNYLPNIEGADTQFITDAINATGMNSQAVVTWQTALANLASAGKVEKIGTSPSNVDRSKLAPGDLIIFGDSTNSHVHIAVYSGTYRGIDFVIHVGNERGPEISRVDWMSQVGDKSSYPNAYYHLPEDIFESDGEIEVYKKDTDGKALEGAVFVATNKDTGKTYKIGPTNSSGYAKSETPVPYGTYTVKETVFPTNYRASGKTEWTVTVDKNNNGLVTINAVNEEIPGSAKIVKTSEDGKVEGIVFTVTGKDFNQTVKTNSKGEWQIDNLKPGVYTVTEQEYNKYVPQESRKVTVVSGQTATVTFNNTLRRGDLTVTKTAEDGLEEGMKFHLYGTSLSGLAVDEYAIVGSDGKARFQGVLIGKGYTLEEVGTPDRYIVPDKQKADIEWNKVTNKSFENDLKRGDLVVTKTAEDGLEEGMRFHLFGTSYSGLPVDEYATVGSDGRAYFNDILIGTGYTLEEVGTPDRYVVPDDQTAAIEWNKVTNKSVDNRLKKWSLTVTKSDSEAGLPQGDATLAGAVYGIYKNGKLIDRYTTDINGQFTTKYYVCGDDWTLQEITPSEGYLIDPTEYHIGAEAKNFTIEYNPISIGVGEDIIKGKIALIKHTDDGETKIETPEVGAEFEVFLKKSGSYANAKETERDYLVCDENGFAETKELPYGVYTVHQVKGWEGREFIGDFDVYVEKDEQTYRYLINNRNFESYVQVIKVDAETNKTIPYAGAGFRIYDPSGNLVKMTFTYPTPTTIDVFYTDSTGMLITPEKLEYGIGYSLVEVQAPYGYVLDETPVYFDIVAKDATEESGVTVVKVNKANMAQKGIITIEKTGEVFFGVSVVGGTDENGSELPTIYQPIYKVQGLPNAVYEIKAAEDIITPDGTLRYKKGEVVDTVTTDKDGFGTSKELYLGKYEVKEIKAPYGMILNDEVHTVELIYAGQNVAVTETATSFYNERQKVEISLSKVIEINELFGIGNNDEILNISFGLFAAEEIVSVSGTVIPADALIEIISLDENGNAVIKTDLPIGSYYVKEIATDEAYILDETKYPVVFDYADQTVAKVEIAVNNGKPIENELIYGSVSGVKVDEDGSPLGGALIGLFKTDGEDFTIENALMTTVSNADGSFSFANIPYGTWYVREIEQPTGFVLNDTVFDVTVAADEQIIEIEIVNEFIRGNIALTKVDADYPDNKLTGVTFEVYKDTNDNCELDEDDELIGTLTEEEIGEYVMNDLFYGRYFVKETVAPEGYLLDKGVYEVFIDTDEMTYQVENKAGVGFANQPIKGNISLTKVDAEYPDNKLTGAIFEVYLDVNANGEIDENDIRIGTLDEGEIGIYEMKNVRYGHYLVREIVAPEGFFLDEGVYPVFVEKNGSTYFIENEAGVGFVNEAMRGSLKVVKTSSDGKVEGFSFRITGPNGFDVTLKTDKNGEIFLENLRIGDYTVSEVADDVSAPYVRPADKRATVLTDSTTIVEMHNVIYDNPKTGDNSHLGLWLGLLGLSAAGIGATAFLGFRKKKKEVAD